MISTLVKKLKSSQFVRFAIIGSITAAIYLVGYNALRATDLASPVAAAVIAYLVAILFQYLGHAWFTFQKPIADFRQSVRFVVLNGLGLILSVLITAGLSEGFDTPDWIISAVVVMLLPVFNWFMMRLWVFAF